MSNKKWYIVYINDQRRINYFPIAINTITDDYDIWIPTKLVYMRKRNKVVETTKPLFPGYVFVNFDFGDGSVENVIKKMCGGVFLRGPGNKNPKTVSDEEMSCIRTLVDERQNPKSVAETYNLEEGQRVEVTTGPFIGHQGLIKQLKKEKVAVEITIFNRSVLAEVDPSSCDPVENNERRKNKR